MKKKESKPLAKSTQILFYLKGNHAIKGKYFSLENDIEFIVHSGICFTSRGIIEPLILRMKLTQGLSSIIYEGLKACGHSGREYQLNVNSRNCI